MSSRMLLIYSVLLILIISTKAFSQTTSLSLPPMSVESSTSASATNTSSTSISTGSSWRDHYAVSYFSIANSPFADNGPGLDRFTSYNYVSLTYKIDADQSFSLRPSFYMNSSGWEKGEKKESELKAADFHVNYANYNIATLPGDIKFTGNYKWYFPTTTSSQDRTMRARVGSWMILNKDFAHGWYVSYNNKPDIYNYRDRATNTGALKYDAGGHPYNEREPNLSHSLDHYIEIGKNFTKDFGIAQDIGYKYYWYYPDADNSKSFNRDGNRKDAFKLSTTVAFSVHPQLNFIAGVEDLIDTRSPSRPNFQLFRPEEMNYVIMTFARM